MPYKNEAALRDQIAKNLTDLEDGLKLLDIEYPLKSRDGAGGRIDILAEDRSGQTVIIEIKRSNETARQALHELSKYITLTQEQEGLARGELRCLLVSTDWHELLVPYSYFHRLADVDVEGKRLIVGQDDKFSYKDIAPLDVRDLPTFSPEFDLFFYDATAECEEHVALMVERAKQLPFLAAAAVLLKPKVNSKLESSLRRSIVCLWRIHDGHHASVEEICGFKSGHLYPYAFPGWELECDVLSWLASENTQLGFPGTAEEQRGSAEKVDNLLERWEPYTLVHLGRFSNGRTLNDAERVVQLLRGQHSRLPLGRRSPRSLNDTVVSTQARSWTSATTIFLEFIQDVPEWHEAARSFIASFTNTGEAVWLSIRASKKKHVFYAIYQAREHAKAALSWFELVAQNGQGDFVDGLIGDWAWDGTCPNDAISAAKQVYGSVDWARLSLFSAVDTQSYADAILMHGFIPLVARIALEESGRYLATPTSPVPAAWTDITLSPLRELLRSRPDYGDQIAEMLHGIPAEPGEGVTLIPFRVLSEHDESVATAEQDSDPVKLAENASDSDDDLGVLLDRAHAEKNPQTRAVLWGKCICYVLSLEDIREGLTYDEIKAMTDEEAEQLAEHMQSVFELRERPRG